MKKQVSLRILTPIAGVVVFLVTLKGVIEFTKGIILNWFGVALSESSEINGYLYDKGAPWVVGAIMISIVVSCVVMRLVYKSSPITLPNTLKRNIPWRFVAKCVVVVIASGAAIWIAKEYMAYKERQTNLIVKWGRERMNGTADSSEVDSLRTVNNINVDSCSYADYPATSRMDGLYRMYLGILRKGLTIEASYEQLKEALKDKDVRKRFYDWATERGVDLGDYDRYNADIEESLDSTLYID